MAGAAEVFAEKGYLRTSLEDIAEHLGITREALYHHFKNKNQIFLEITLGPSRLLLRRIEEVRRSRRQVLDKLHQAIEIHVAVLVPTYLDMIIAFREDHRLRNDRSFAKLRLLERKYNACWIDLVRQGRKSGELRRGADEKIIVFGILGMCNWLARWYDPNQEISPREIAQVFFDMIACGLATKDPVGGRAPITGRRPAQGDVRCSTPASIKAASGLRVAGHRSRRGAGR